MMDQLLILMVLYIQLLMFNLGVPVKLYSWHKHYGAQTHLMARVTACLNKDLSSFILPYVAAS